MTKRLLPLGVVVLLLGAVAGYWRYSATHRPPEVQYKTATVERKRIAAKVTATGILAATVTVQVGTQVSGRIAQLLADFNSPVKKGQVIAKIDPQLFIAAVAQSRANFVSAEASLTKARAQALEADRQAARLKALNAENLASQGDLELSQTNAAVAKAGIDVAVATLEQARASLNQAQVNLSYTTIVSPIDGVVISRNVDVGQTVAASLSAPVIFTIAEDLRKMQVNTSVAEGDIGRLRPDMDAFFTVDAYPGQKFRGKIWQIRNAATTVQNVVTYDAVLNVDNTDLRLRPGMTASCTVTYDERDSTLAVPNAALRFRPPPDLSAPSTAPTRGPGVGRGGGHKGADAGADPIEARTVWVLRGLAPTPVALHTGLSDGTVTEVIDGDLKEGDAVVTDTLGAAGKAGAAPSGGPNALRRMF